jgi:hypothetical protein
MAALVSVKIVVLGWPGMPVARGVKRSGDTKRSRADGIKD